MTLFYNQRNSPLLKKGQYSLTTILGVLWIFWYYQVICVNVTTDKFITRTFTLYLKWLVHFIGVGETYIQVIPHHPKSLVNPQKIFNVMCESLGTIILLFKEMCVGTETVTWHSTSVGLLSVKRRVSYPSHSTHFGWIKIIFVARVEYLGVMSQPLRLHQSLTPVSEISFLRLLEVEKRVDLNILKFTVQNRPFSPLIP